VLGESGGPVTSGEANAVRVRVVPGADPRATVAAVHEICAAHRGRVPLFLHMVLPTEEVVVRARGVLVDASPELTEQLGALLEPTAITVEYAGRA
jgi:hypothetical protein